MSKGRNKQIVDDYMFPPLRHIKEAKQQTMHKNKPINNTTYINLELRGLGWSCGRLILEENHRQCEGDHAQDELHQHEVRHAVHSIVVVSSGCLWGQKEKQKEVTCIIK